MSESRSGERSGMVWPGFGLVMGAGLGSVVGLLLFSSSFYLGTGAGAGLGLVAGAVVDMLSKRRDPTA